MSIRRETVYLHLAAIRKMLGAHNSIEMLQAMHNVNGFNPNSLKLTPRGTEVFCLILAGLSDKRIGERLGISYSGVRRHKEKMLLGNGCETMLELVAKYYAACADSDVP